jgi:CHRD domain
MIGTRLRIAAAAASVFALAGASIALAGAGKGKDDDNGFSAHLIGFNEVPANNTAGHGDLTFTMTSTQITFRLVYADLSGPPAAAHIHVGQKNVNGGVSVFFCGGGGQAACPTTTSGTVTGTITAANVVGPTAQGFNVGDLAAVERAIKAGVTYANMHTAKFPAGEIRGQVRRGGNDDGDKDNKEKKKDK